MITEKEFKERCADILRKNITFSHQVGDYVIHGALDALWQLHTEQNLNIHSVMQGCQCKDRIGETKVWCCNQCGLPCEDFWLPTHYTVGSRTVGNSADGQSGRDGVMKWCDSCGKITKWIDGDCENYKTRGGSAKGALPR